MRVKMQVSECVWVCEVESERILFWRRGQEEEGRQSERVGGEYLGVQKKRKGGCVRECVCVSDSMAHSRGTNSPGKTMYLLMCT